MNTVRLTSPSYTGIPEEDLQRCHDLLGLTSWLALEGKRIFLTGGTGFVGKWMLSTLLDAKKKLRLNCQVTVLSRNPSVFLRQWPALVGCVEWVEGDVRDFMIGTSRFDVIIHAATDVVAITSPGDVFTTCLDGTRQVLKLARQCGASNLLLVSSGAVYGPLPSGMTHVPETYLGGPDPLKTGSAYGEGKRVSEWIAAQAADDTLSVKIARLFAMVGPHLSLDKHFAIGNFIRDAMTDKEIIIEGDGTPFRSFLYSADMAAWLWAVLLRGLSGRAYNVGSDESLTILSLAEKVRCVTACASKITVKNERQSDSSSSHYVPNIFRAQQELGLPKPMALDEAIARTASWNFRKVSYCG